MTPSVVLTRTQRRWMLAMQEAEKPLGVRDLAWRMGTSSKRCTPSLQMLDRLEASGLVEYVSVRGWAGWVLTDAGRGALR